MHPYKKELHLNDLEYWCINILIASMLAALIAYTKYADSMTWGIFAFLLIINAMFVLTTLIRLFNSMKMKLKVAFMNIRLQICHKLDNMIANAIAKLDVSFQKDFLEI
jgi:hypothetical protein